MVPKRIFVSQQMLPEAEELLATGGELVFGVPRDEVPHFVKFDDGDPLQARIRNALEQELPTAHAVYGYIRLGAREFERAGALEVVIAPGSGYEHVDVEAATEYGVAVVNAAGPGNIPVAEHTIGLMLSLVKWIAVTDRHAHSTGHQRSWSETTEAIGGMPSTLWRKTLGLVGFGFIGRTVAQRCMAGFGMNVLVHDPFFDPEEAERLGVMLVADLADVLAESDFVSVHCPLTPKTAKIIGRAEFETMKSSAYLINTSRGGTVDTEALVDALQEGSLAGAGLDVVDPEPLPTGHPLLAMENVVITPHLGGIVSEFQPLIQRASIREGLAALEGRRPHHLVNRTFGQSFWLGPNETNPPFAVGLTRFDGHLP